MKEEIFDLKHDYLLESFAKAACDKSYNPSGEDYNDSGFTYDELQEELLRRLYFRNDRH